MLQAVSVSESNGAGSNGAPASGSTHGEQFDIAGHYDAMAELDRDVHDNFALSDSEIETALRLVCGNPNDPVQVPASVFVPCFGTGRHIEPLLRRGVRRIVGVDLSPKCVGKAVSSITIPRGASIEFKIGDLATWHTGEKFDAVLMLGNSFGDIVDPAILSRVTAGMVAPLKSGGAFVMDYIGRGNADRCNNGSVLEWDAEFHGRPVYDRRRASYNPATGIMTISVSARYKDTNQVAWSGAYQKRVMTDAEVRAHFTEVGVMIERVGLATRQVPYYRGHTGEMGMLARSSWWVGRRR